MKRVGKVGRLLEEKKTALGRIAKSDSFAVFTIDKLDDSKGELAVLFNIQGTDQAKSIAEELRKAAAVIEKDLEEYDEED